MTPAELKTYRENFGLTVQWLAAKSNVAHRTISYWEAGNSKVPEDVAELILSVKSKIESAADEAIKQISTIIQTHGIPDEITLLRYKTDQDLHKYRKDFATADLPVTCHIALLGIIVNEMRLMGIKAKIVYFDEPAYLCWLAGRADNEAMRSAWAASI